MPPKKKNIPVDEPPPPPKKKDEGPPPEEGLPPWMATFADMVTLLLCFFVLLLSFTNQDVNNFKVLMGSVQKALGVQKEHRDALSAPYAETRFDFEDRQKKNREMVELGTRLKEYIRATDLTQTAKVSNEKSGVMMRVMSKALFDKGSAQLLPSAPNVLDGIIRSMKDKDFNLIIRGHTDTERPAGLYNSNWELSAARAAACLRYILEHSDIKSTRMKAVGYADAKPILPSTSEANRAVNRRVEFFYVPDNNRTW